MKKIICITLSILFIFILCSCKPSSSKYNLIELQSTELLNYLKNEEKHNIIIALYYETKSNSKTYMDSLQKVVNNINNNIYYINMDHLDEESLYNIFDYLEGDYYSNSYIAYQNGEIKVNSNFSDFKTLVKELKPLSIKEDEVPKIDKEVKLAALKEAEEKYNSGNISEALATLNKAWDLEEAKKAYQENKYYMLIGNWEAYHVLESNTNKVKYISLDIYSAINVIYLYETEAKLDEVEKPKIIDYKRYYYYVKDNIIYLKESEKSKKSIEKYRIIDTTSEIIRLKDIKDDKIYNFKRRQ